MLRIDRTLYNMMTQHAVEEHPEECCGVLLGTRTNGSARVLDLLRISNTVIENRTHRFLIGPDDYQRAEEEAARRDAEIVGFYHSHPDHPARPSQFDLDHAFPWWSYVIISVTQGKTERVASWVMKEDRSSFDEEAIEILGPDSSP